MYGFTAAVTTECIDGHSFNWDSQSKINHIYESNLLFQSTFFLATVLAMVKSHLSKQAAFQMCLLTCMRMNLGIQFLGYLFGVSSSSVSRILYDVLTVMHTRLVPLLILWPECDILKMSMSMSFRSKFGKCACIIDSFEVFIERPSDLKARAQTYSTYKSHNNMKISHRHYSTRVNLIYFQGVGGGVRVINT